MGQDKRARQKTRKGEWGKTYNKRAKPKSLRKTKPHIHRSPDLPPDLSHCLIKDITILQVANTE